MAPVLPNRDVLKENNKGQIGAPYFESFYFM